MFSADAGRCAQFAATYAGISANDARGEDGPECLLLRRLDTSTIRVRLVHEIPVVDLYLPYRERFSRPLDEAEDALGSSTKDEFGRLLIESTGVVPDDSRCSLRGFLDQQTAKSTGKLRALSRLQGYHSS